MTLTVNGAGWKRFFQVPCAIVDNYLKLADGPALKVLLYLLSSESPPDADSVVSSAGITREAFDEAVSFWREMGVISVDGEAPAKAPAQTVSPAQAEPVRKIVHSQYSPKDIAEMLKCSAELKELFSEAESTLGRILRHSDHEMLISLRDYYGFSEQSIVLILGYCAEREKTSARYCETVAQSLFERGITDFHSIETEFERLRELNTFEAKIRSNFGLESRLTPQQKRFIESWREMGFDVDMISLARERCVDNTNKLSFPYINKVLTSWKEKGIFTPEAAENEAKPQKQKDGSHSYDLDEFDMFTLRNSGKEKK